MTINKFAEQNMIQVSHQRGFRDLEDALSRAKRLGYLKAAHPTGPVIEAYRDWSHEHGKPMVLLVPGKGRTATIIYRIPDFDRAISPEALSRIRGRIRPSLSPGSHPQPILCRCGGELIGLDPSKAESVAFWIADAALDPGQTGPLLP